ncbi:MAG: hypothetical protein U0792_25190 [Gemmataceae bacterium]
MNQFLKQFEQVRGLMKQMAEMSMWQRLKMVTGLGKAGAFLPGGMDQFKTKGNTGHRKTAKERAEERKKKRSGGDARMVPSRYYLHPGMAVKIRTYRAGDEAAQTSIYNEAAAALPGFKPATQADVEHRTNAEEFDPQPASTLRTAARSSATAPSNPSRAASASHGASPAAKPPHQRSSRPSHS